VVTEADLDAILLQAETVSVEEMQAMADAIAEEAGVDAETEEPVRYGRPVFTLGAAGAAPLGSIPAAPKPSALDDEALTDMLPKIRQIIGRKLRDGE
jgi:hypothetical protein